MKTVRLICFLSLEGLFAFNFSVSAEILLERDSEWRFFKGTEEPSRGVVRWWEAEFDDSDWQIGRAPFRYGDGRGGTVLNDMRGRYSTVFLRRRFVVGDLKEGSVFDLIADFDDGMKVWINGKEVLAVNVPRDPRFDSFAADSRESGQFEVFPIEALRSILKTGVNVIAVQGFNISHVSSDFLMNVELKSIEPDFDPPQVTSISPEPSKVEAMEPITILFSEPVVGIDISDLLLNGQSAESLEGQGDTWTFSFGPVYHGEATITFAADHGIRDEGRPPNPLDTAAIGDTLTYQIVDDVPPKVIEVVPPPQSTLKKLSRIRLFFSEPIDGFETTDILVNGAHPVSINGLADGPWDLDFEAITEGTADISWSANHGITDRARQPNRFDGAPWSYSIRADHQPESIVINEILASNQKGLADEDGRPNDWIELKNTGREPVNLGGWSLSDEPGQPGKWMFPAVTIAPGGYLVVFASGKNRRDPESQLHTNFKLNANGDYLGFFGPELPRRRVDQVSARYPQQRNDTSYGRLASGKLVYFLRPTPGGENGMSGIETALAKPDFSVKRGFYSSPISVRLSSPYASAVIRYTTDHSAPTPTNGKVYRRPIPIRRTTVLRAAAFGNDTLASDVATQTYIFDRSNPMTSLPVLSLATDEDNLWGRTGIMEVRPRNTNKRGIEWERPVSAELLIPDKSDEGFQFDCGLRIQGGDHIRDHYRRSSKYSFRLYFRGEHGPGRLEYPIVPHLPVNEFERIVLRAGMNDPHNPFIADELVRRLHHDMGQPASQGTILNLFLNGKYKGYYNATERIDNAFLRSRHGGGEDWDLIAQFGQVREGDMIEWDRLKDSAIGRDLSQPANYAEVERQMDIVNFIDYLVLNVCVGMDDWPDNNWRAARERVAKAKWRFYVWDAERSFGKDIWNFRGSEPVSRDNLTRGALTGRSAVAEIFRSLMANPEFRLKFADRIHKHLFNGGALTDENISRRHSELVGVMKAVLPNMDPFIEKVWIPKRRAIVMGQFDRMGLLRSKQAPHFSQHGGKVSVGYRLSIAAPEGRIYCTLDGKDPGWPGAEPNATQAYENQIAIDEPMTIKARTWVDGRWSALTEATFLPEPIGHPIRISEVMYNPPGGSEYEFVELLNTSGVKVDLGWFTFDGIDFTFGMADSIDPGARIVLASNGNPPAFLKRYPRLQVYGWFDGKLANNGERLSLEHPNGGTVTSVTYDDGGAWPSDADGRGASLERIDPFGRGDSPSNWTASATPGGTPTRP